MSLITASVNGEVCVYNPENDFSLEDRLDVGEGVNSFELAENRLYVRKKEGLFVVRDGRIEQVVEEKIEFEGKRVTEVKFGLVNYFIDLGDEEARVYDSKRGLVKGIEGKYEKVVPHRQGFVLVQARGSAIHNSYSVHFYDRMFRHLNTVFLSEERSSLDCGTFDLVNESFFVDALHDSKGSHRDRIILTIYDHRGKFVKRLLDMDRWYDDDENQRFEEMKAHRFSSGSYIYAKTCGAEVYAFDREFNRLGVARYHDGHSPLWYLSSELSFFELDEKEFVVVSGNQLDAYFFTPELERLKIVSMVGRGKAKVTVGGKDLLVYGSIDGSVRLFNSELDVVRELHDLKGEVDHKFTRSISQVLVGDYCN